MQEDNGSRKAMMKETEHTTNLGHLAMAISNHDVIQWLRMP
jgi:hypothetical protein